MVPFPFTDRATVKRRPALVLSSKAFNRHGYSVLAMITSAAHQPWPGDTSLQDLRSAGLEAQSRVRLKIFTIDNRFIVRRIGTLGSLDREAVAGELEAFLPVRAG